MEGAAAAAHQGIAAPDAVLASPQQPPQPPQQIDATTSPRLPLALRTAATVINPGKHEKYKKVLFLDPSFFTDEMHMPPAWASAAPPHKPWTGWNPRTERWSTNLGATAPPSTPTRSAGLDNTNNIPKVVNANAAITATGEGIKRAATPRATATPRTTDSAWNSTGAARSKKSAAVFKRLSAGATSSVAPPAATPRTPKLYTGRDPLIPRPPAAEAAAGSEESDESPAASCGGHPALFHLSVDRRMGRPLLLCFLLRFSQGLGVLDRVEEVGVVVAVPAARRLSRRPAAAFVSSRLPLLSASARPHL
nr:uncharacterized protein LOC127328952 [Lolium perenne]